MIETCIVGQGSYPVAQDQRGFLYKCFNKSLESALKCELVENLKKKVTLIDFECVNLIFVQVVSILMNTCLYLP